MRNYILLTLAVLAGLLAFFIAKKQLEVRYRELAKKTREIPVYVPVRDLLPGDEIQANNIGPRTILASEAPSDVVEEKTGRDYLSLYGQRVVVPVARDEPLEWSDFAYGDVRGATNLLARIVPKGERALSIPVDSVSSVSGMVRPNDHIDILGTFRFPGEEGGQILDAATLTILQNVTVLAVGQQMATTGPAMAGRGSYSTVTLSVTPEEAEMLVFALQKGNLTLTLRSPADIAAPGDRQSVDFQYLKDHINAYNEARQQRLKPAGVDHR